MYELPESGGFITAVQQQRNNRHRFNIYVDDEYVFAVHEDILVKHRIIKGERMDPSRIEQVLQDEELHKAYADALGFIGRRPRSRQEVLQKLQHKGYAQSIMDQVVGKLLERDYINDQQFAKIWTEHRIHAHKKGRKWIQQELIAKGLSKQHITEALSEIDSEEEFQNAYHLAAKKWNQLRDLPKLAKNQKTAAFLIRRGFPNDIVRRILGQLNEVTDD
jgi:regulatory protein